MLVYLLISLFIMKANLFVEFLLFLQLSTFLLLIINKKKSEKPGLKQCGVYDSETDISFTNMFNDIRKAVDTVHHNGELKDKTMDMIDQLVERSPNLSSLLDRLKKSGKKTFLLTNSGYSYTERLMSFMLNGFMKEKPNWKDYFGLFFISLPHFPFHLFFAASF